jgi:hypothetical protein
LFRRYLVEPASMWWPQNLVQVSLFRYAFWLVLINFSIKLVLFHFDSVWMFKNIKNMRQFVERKLGNCSDQSPIALLMIFTCCCISITDCKTLVFNSLQWTNILIDSTF